MTATLSRPAATSPNSRRHRRGTIIVLAALAVVVAVAGALTVLAVRRARDDSRRDYLDAAGWPVRGQAAFRLGDAPAQASPGQHPVPIASLAKVMSALVVLDRLPLHDGDAPSVTVTAEDVRATAARRADDESVVAIRAGERLSERQALVAILLPSANNVAALLPRLLGDTTARFVERMNATAHALGMRHTTYTDPSGFDPNTISTAADQLILERAASAVPTFAQLAALRSARLPVAGTVSNTDLLLGRDGFLGTKTGSDDSAGGCFMFHVRRPVQGTVTDIYGVVLGQQGTHPLTAGLYAGRQFAASVATGRRAGP